MRVIGAGLAVFLSVITILLYQATSGGSDTSALSVVASPELTIPSPTSLLPTATLRPAQIAPTATATIPRPTAIPATPLPDTMVAPLASESTTKEAVSDEVEHEIVESDDDAPIESSVDIEVTEDEDVHSPHLAAVDSSDAWLDAIQTPNGGMIGIVLSGLANVRSMPTLDADVTGELHAGWPIAIYSVVTGDSFSGSDIWYQVNSGYVSAELIGPYSPPAPDVSYDGHWVDVDLSNNIAVAYVDDTPVNAVTIISGKFGFETPLGVHTIFARVESETLDSATVGIPEGDPEYYYLPDVPYTQYFATGGFAIHGNYWSDDWQFGSALSHGCINMFSEDAAWFWWFLDEGSVVNVHS